MNILSADRKFLKVRIPRSLDEYLISRQNIAERRNYLAGEEVEDKTEGDGDG